MRPVRLKRLCSVITRGSTPTYTEFATCDACVVGQSCQRPDGAFDVSRARWHVGPLPDKGLLSGRDVLVNSTGTGTLGRVAITPPAFGSATFADTHVTVVRANPCAADPRFLAYVLGQDSFRRLAEEGLSVGATKQKELNVEALRDHVIYSPTVGVQREVADFLDRESDRIRSAIRTAGDAIASLTRVERAIADAAVFGLPYLPLKAVATIHSGVTLNEAKAPADAVRVPYLRVANVKAGWLDLDEIKEVPVSPQDAPRYELKPGDLLLTEGGDLDKLGRGALWAGDISPCLFQNHVFAVRPRREAAVPAFLSWATRSSAARSYFESTASRITNIASTNRSKLGRWPIPDAPIAEQRRRVAVAESAWQRAQHAISTAHDLSVALTAYRTSLIHEAVTGKLDVTKVTERQMDERLHAAAEDRLDEVPV